MVNTITSLYLRGTKEFNYSPKQAMYRVLEIQEKLGMLPPDDHKDPTHVDKEYINWNSWEE